MRSSVASIGDRFGRLVVISKGKRDNAGRQRLICKCDCGTEKEFDAHNIISRKSKSCGCLKLELTIKRNTKHGMSRSSEYNSWTYMIQRCTNSSFSEYHRYGARGITVCERWRNSFEAFLADMGARPPGRSLERIKNDQNYEPENCKWATPVEQARNRRSNRWLTCHGRTQLLVDWADELGVCHSTIINRLKRGWSIEKALSVPKGGKRDANVNG